MSHGAVPARLLFGLSPSRKHRWLSSLAGDREQEAGHKKEHQHRLTKRILIESAVVFPAEPGTCRQQRQADCEQAHAFLRDDAKAAEEENRDNERGCRCRLKYRPLLIARPVAHGRPNGRYETAEPRRAGKRAIQNANAGICDPSSIRCERQPCPRKTVDAVEDQDRTDAHTEVTWRYPAQRGNAERDAKGATDDERCQTGSVEGMPKLPDSISLNDERVRDDECGHLSWRQGVQPDACGHDGEGEADDTVHKRRSER